MKYIAINARRRNPEINNVRNNTALLVKYYDLDVSETGKGLGNYYISFTTEKKVGLNPKNAYGTPIGIYTYPLKAIFPLIETNDVPFASKRAYIQVVKKNTKKVLWSETYRRSKLEHDIVKCETIFNNHEETILQNWDDAVSRLTTNFFNIRQYFAQEHEKNFSTIKDLAMTLAQSSARRNRGKVSAFRYIWSMTLILSYFLRPKTYTTIWNNLFRAIGYQAVIDYGTGTIHPHEKLQAVFFLKSALTHVDMIKTFKDKQQSEVDEMTRHERESVGSLNNLISFNGKLYDVNNLPDNLVIQGDLELPTKVRHLPNNLIVHGTVDLRGHTIDVPKRLTCDSLIVPRSWKTLPEELYVTNTLNIENSDITRLPDTITSLQNLYAGFSQIQDLNNLQSVDELYINHTPISKLPDNLSVGDLSIPNTKIEYFPKGIKIAYSLTADHCPLKEQQVKGIAEDASVIIPSDMLYSKKYRAFIPKDKKLKGGMDYKELNITSDTITSLPKNLSAESIEIDGANKLKKLPHGLVAGHFSISQNHSIKSIPDDIQCERIDIDDSSITTLPDNLTLSILQISDTDIETLPKNLHCTALSIKNTKVTEIQDITGLRDLSIYSSDTCTLRGLKLARLSYNKPLKLENCNVEYCNVRSDADNSIPNISVQDSKLGYIQVQGSATLNLASTKKGEILIHRLKAESNTVITTTKDLTYVKTEKNGPLENVTINGNIDLQINQYVHGDVFLNNVIINGTVKIVQHPWNFYQAVYTPEDCKNLIGENVQINGKLIVTDKTLYAALPEKWCEFATFDYA